jgi:hypothetical protein
MDIIPDRTNSSNMEKRDKESIKEYMPKGEEI